MSKHSRSKTVWRVILAIVSVLVIVALATVAVIYRPTWIHADSPVTQRSSYPVPSVRVSWKHIVQHE